jgi:hypothetical protein
MEHHGSPTRALARIDGPPAHATNAVLQQWIDTISAQTGVKRPAVKSKRKALVWAAVVGMLGEQEVLLTQRRVLARSAAMEKAAGTRFSSFMLKVAPVCLVHLIVDLSLPCPTLHNTHHLESLRTLAMVSRGFRALVGVRCAQLRKARAGWPERPILESLVEKYIHASVSFKIDAKGLWAKGVKQALRRLPARTRKEVLSRSDHIEWRTPYGTLGQRYQAADVARCLVSLLSDAELVFMHAKVADWMNELQTELSPPIPQKRRRSLDDTIANNMPLKIRRCSLIATGSSDLCHDCHKNIAAQKCTQQRCACCCDADQCVRHHNT